MVIENFWDTTAWLKAAAVGFLVIFLCLLLMPLGSANAQPQTNQEKVNSIRRLIELQGLVTELKRTIQDTLASTSASMDENQARLVAALAQELEAAGLEELLQSIASVYDKYLTEEEIRESLNLYESSSQSPINRKKPEIVAEVIRIGRDWLGRSVTKVLSQHLGLIDAAMIDNQSIVSELLNNGVDVNSRNPDGMTALIVSARTGNTEMGRLLLEKGANVNSRTNSGETALMAAVLSGKEELIALLLSKGADPNAKDDRGINPYQLADFMDKKGAATLLKKKTADTNPVTVSIVVGKLGEAKDCLPVMNFPTASSKKLKCLKVGDEVVPDGVETTEGWELIKQPVAGWVPPGTLKPVFKVTHVGGNTGKGTSDEGEEAAPSRRSRGSREDTTDVPQQEDSSSGQGSGGKWWKGR